VARSEPRRRTRRRPMSEINVVPYIDVMLVLLIIFMVTAPLLSQGVKVDLPKADAQAMDTRDREPLIVSVDIDGAFYVNYGDDKDKPIGAQDLVTRVSALLRLQPGTPVAVRGDKDVKYAQVVYVMTLLQKAGAGSVGLMTDPPQSLPQSSNPPRAVRR
jgi:biopolymer transport protein TolR